MAGASDERIRHFYQWERRGRGWQSFPYPVRLEPSFVPFRYLRELKPPEDDGKHHTALSRFLERFSGKRAKPAPVDKTSEEAGPEPFEGGARRELVLLPPRDLVSTPALMEAWQKSLSTLESSVSFELVGMGGRVGVLASAGENDASLIRAQLQAFFPTLEVEEGEDFLLSVFEEERDRGLSAVEFGLAREFLLPLREAKSFSSPDPLTGLVAALREAREDEVALVQVLFEGVTAPWAGSILRSVTTPSGAPFFSNAPDFSRFAREKASLPLFAVAIRAAVIAEDEDRLWTLLRGIGGALAGATRGANELVPLGCEDLSDLLGDIFLRATRRPGMILSLPELLTLVHLPGREVEGIVRETARTKALPAEAQRGGVFLGWNRDHGVVREARLSVETRMRHVHVVGASGTGKSTLLVSMILQDIAEGHGVGVIDPHGDLIDAVLGRITPDREEDTILFDPSDPDYAVGWNILSAHSEAEREMLASDLVAAFRRLATSWGDQMTAVLANAILVFLDSETGGTLSDLRRFLADQGFRKSFLSTVRDQYIREFWTTEFPLIKGKPEGSILSRLDTLLRSRLVRGVVTAREKPLDFGHVVDEGRIFLARLSQGAIGEENAALLGSLLVSKVHQVSLLRQDRAAEDRRPFFLYLDEFHNLATPSMAGLFSGVRKYRLGVTVAHQDLYQLRSSVPEVERSVLANAYTRIAFQLGDEDARTLAKTLSFFTAEDLGNLEIGEAIVRMGRRENDFNLRTVPLDRGDPETLAARGRDVRASALARWGVLRTEEPPKAPAPPEPLRAPLPNTKEPSIPKGEAAPAPPTPTPAEAIAPPPTEPRRPGKGGPEHTYLQELVKRWGEEKGFRAVVEEQIPGGRESIDIALYRGEMKIACEVSVTTSLEYEVGNVLKCLAAGFGTVAVVSLKKTRLAKLGKLLDEAIPPESRTKVHLFTTEELLSWLEGQPIHEEVKTVRGYRVKVKYRDPGDDRLKRVAEILARSTNGLQKG